MSDRIFLHANVLVSAAWQPENGPLALWELGETVLLTSAYAIAEADRNVRTSEQRTRLHRLVQRVRIVDEPGTETLPATVRLPVKDIPILLAAIEAGADYVVTGDLEHFGPYFGESVAGVHILRPRDYLARRQTT